jgi:membrane protein required for colicin V production
MIEAQLSIFDLVVISVLALSCLFAFFRGFVREILSLGAWIGAGLVTIYFFPEASKYLKPYFKSETVAAGFSALGLYIVSLIGFSMMNGLIMKFVKSGSDVGILDNLLGLFFGAFRGALIVSLGFFLLSLALPEKQYPEWLEKSATRPYVEQGAMLLAKVAPQYLRDISSLQKKAADKAQRYQPDDEEEAPAESETGTGYKRDAVRQMDRLIDSTSGTR